MCYTSCDTSKTASSAPLQPNTADMSPASKRKVLSEKNHNKPYEKSSLRHGYHPKHVYMYICFRPVTIDTMLRDICLNSKLVETEREQNIPAGSRRQRREHLCPIAPTGLDYLQ